MGDMGALNLMVVQRLFGLVFGGTTEIMKEIISRGVGP